ncbi:hypothetical protein SCUP234_12174 [Seiridium cupressi]
MDFCRATVDEASKSRAAVALRSNSATSAVFGSERKVGVIKLLLQELNVTSEPKELEIGLCRHLAKTELGISPVIHQPITAFGGEPHLWDHSAHILHLVKAIVIDKCSMDAEPGASKVTSSVKTLLEALMSPTAFGGLSFTNIDVVEYHAETSMDPLQAGLTALK